MKTLIDASLGKTDYGWVMDGMVVWASAFERTSDCGSLEFHQKPIKGIAAYSKYAPIGPADPSKPAPPAAVQSGRNARYFIPFKKNVDEPAWSKAVTIRSRDISETEAEAIESYNAKIQADIDMHRLIIDRDEAYLIR